MPQGDVAMADPSSSRPNSFNPEEAARPPTFVQLHEPAPSTAPKLVAVVSVGIALVTALGWAAYRLTAEQGSPVAMQAAATLTETLPPQSVPADPNAELTRLALDAAVSESAWPQESLMESISPFDASTPARRTTSDAPPADTHNAPQPGSYEVLVHLVRGDTIESVLHDLGFEAESIADAVSALAPHVRLKRLPIGLGMTLQVRPAEKAGTKPVLQALTIQPDGRREITVERNDEGNYVVELPARPTTR